MSDHGWKDKTENWLFWIEVTGHSVNWLFWIVVTGHSVNWIFWIVVTGHSVNWIFWIVITGQRRQWWQLSEYLSLFESWKQDNSRINFEGSVVNSTCHSMGLKKICFPRYEFIYSLVFYILKQFI